VWGIAVTSASGHGEGTSLRDSTSPSPATRTFGGWEKGGKERPLVWLRECLQGEECKTALRFCLSWQRQLKRWCKAFPHLALTIVLELKLPHPLALLFVHLLSSMRVWFSVIPLSVRAVLPVKVRQKFWSSTLSTSGRDWNGDSCHHLCLETLVKDPHYLTPAASPPAKWHKGDHSVGHMCSGLLRSLQVSSLLWVPFL
jgi:hypothetical protein